MKKLTAKEIKKVELEILLEFADFCDENNLTYALAYGTLLGAVRHQGFIPWDDDIDVVMPRNDYSRLISLAASGLFPNSLKVESTETSGYLPAFAKVVNPNIEVSSGRNVDNAKENLWIDIFPLDGIPNSSFKQKVLYLKSKILGTLSVVTTLNWHYKSTFIMQAAVFLFGPIGRHIPLERWASKKLQDLCIRIPYNEASLIGVIAWGSGTNEILPRSTYENLTELSFEGHSFKAPKDYHLVLKKQYGKEYMKLPPESQRVSHELDAYFKTT